MLLDEIAPKWDACRTESCLLAAERGAAYDAVLNSDFTDAVRHQPVKALFAVRTGVERIVSSLLGRARAVAPEPAALRLREIPRRGEWVKLGEDPPREIVFGAIGRFWAGETVWQEIEASEFSVFQTPGYARIACRFLVECEGGGSTRVTYEARTTATDGRSRRAFLRYWRFVSPLVGIVMRAQLSVIAQRAARDAARDPLLDQFMPRYEIAERHCIRVSAPADVVLASAGEMDLGRSRIVRAIIRAREWILGSRSTAPLMPAGIIAQTRAMGWGLLAEVPGREIVMGAITQPWAANVVFRAVPAEQFAAYDESGHVKIAWTLRADPLDDQVSMFRTETRVVACDAEARSRFRRYWRVFSPGIVLIRRALLGPLKRDAEAAYRKQRGSADAAPG